MSWYFFMCYIANAKMFIQVTLYPEGRFTQLVSETMRKWVVPIHNRLTFVAWSLENLLTMIIIEIIIILIIIILIIIMIY